MRERFAQNGLSGFAPHEALELLLYYAIPRRNVNPLAHNLLRHFGTLEAVLQADPVQLRQVPGIGDGAATLLAMVLPLARLAERQRTTGQPIITNYREAKAYCRTLFDGKGDEVLYVISLDAQGRVLHATAAITGTIDEIAIYPRTVISCALRHNAHAVVLAHNHPSGVCEPSDADVRTTETLKDALSSIDIALLDHVIYADGECVSMQQWQQMKRITPLYPDAGAPKAADTKRRRTRAASVEDATGVMEDTTVIPDLLYEYYQSLKETDDTGTDEE